MIIATGLYIQYIDPTYTKILALQTKIADIEAHKVDAASAQSRIDALERTARSFPDNYEDRLQMLVPTVVDPTRLIIDVNQMAEDQGLHLGSPQVAVASNDKKGSAFVKHTITFSVSAPYDTFRKFVASLEYNLALRDATNISFTNATQGDIVNAAHPETLPYQYSFAITTYSLQ